MLKYQSIGQFREIIRQVKDKTYWAGYDENGQPKFDYTRPLPTLEFTGNTKIHGCNAGVRFDFKEGDLIKITPQSREREISIDSDNAGFALWVTQDHITQSVKEIVYIVLSQTEHPLPDEYTICIFGEWAGKNIQKGVGVCNLPKQMYIFEIQLKVGDKITRLPIPNIMPYNELGIFNVNDFGTFSISVDFERPEIAQNEIIKLVEQVENCCPVAAAQGFPNTVGEGIVWVHDSPEYGFLICKTKGEKHSSSKVKTVAAVDIEAFNKIQEFVSSVCTESRLSQSINYLKEMEIPIEMKNVGQYIKRMNADVIKEEMDTIVANQFDPKKVANLVSNISRKYFINYIDSEV